MSDVKWIKVVTDIFDNRKMKQIESMPEGDAIMVVWIKLLCLAGVINDGGRIYVTGELPYTDQMLATQFNKSLPVIQLALSTFERFRMIEIIDSFIHVSQWEKYQNIEGLEKVKEQNRIRKRNQREREALEDKCHVMSRDSHATDKNRLDKIKDITVSKDTVCQTEVRRIVNSWNDLTAYGIKSILKVNTDSQRYSMLIARIKQYSVDDVLKAIENIKTSDFLQGKSKAGWVITFDWFVRPNNFPKVLEGNYNDKSNVPESRGSMWQE